MLASIWDLLGCLSDFADDRELIATPLIAFALILCVSQLMLRKTPLRCADTELTGIALAGLYLAITEYSALSSVQEALEPWAGTNPTPRSWIEFLGLRAAIGIKVVGVSGSLVLLASATPYLRGTPRPDVEAG